MDRDRNEVKFAIESMKQHETRYFADVGTKYQNLRLEIDADEFRSWDRF
jgi:hypothetical protein